MIPQSLGFVVVSSAGTKVPLSSSPLQVRAARIQPRSAAGVVNVGNVYLKTGTGTVYAVLSPEQVEGIPVPFWTDLSQWFVDADNSGDGVCVGYWAGP